jgi:hypothetical protein
MKASLSTGFPGEPGGSIPINNIDSLLQSSYNRLRSGKPLNPV